MSFETTMRHSQLAYALNDLSKLCRSKAEKWYHNPATGERIFWETGVRFVLMHSELSEAFEADRKNTMDAHLTNRMGVEVELADLLIRVFDYAGENNLDLGGALIEKLEYNRTREDHTYEARMQPGGKKY